MKKILMLGGAFSQIPAIKRAKELGYYVITCDYLPNNPGHAFADKYENISTVDMEAVLQFAMKEHIDGIIAYASDPSANTAAYVSEKMKLPGASMKAVKLLSEKDLFRNLQKENGFNVPDFYTVSSLEADIFKNMSFPCVVKPVDSSGSKGVSKVDSKGRLEQAIRTAMNFSRCGKVIIESYIDTPYCQLHGDGVVVDGKLVFVALGDQRFCDSVPIGSSLPSQVGDEMVKKVCEEASKLITCSGFDCGGVNIEARITQEGEIYIIELGPRTGGNYVPQLMELATGTDEMTAVLQIAMGEGCNIKETARMQYCFQYIIGSDESGIFQRLDIDEYIQEKVAKVFLHKKAGDYVERYENSNGVVGVVLLQFMDATEMNRDIEYIKDHIKIIVER